MFNLFKYFFFTVFIYGCETVTGSDMESDTVFDDSETSEIPDNNPADQLPYRTIEVEPRPPHVPGEYNDDYTLAVIVSSNLESELESSLVQYQQDVLEDDFFIKIFVWDGGSAEELRDLIFEEKDSHDIKGAWFIGDLPAVWYEQDAFETHEEFPMDLYFMDPDARWKDANQNGIFDYHNDLYLNLFISRLMGTPEELTKYFAKIHHYRKLGASTSASAYIFKDDDWQDVHKGGKWGLDALYPDVEICETAECTTRDEYIDKFSADSAEYVYQWIHSAPAHLRVAEEGDGKITIDDLMSLNPRGAFYNLFDCFAARYTETNIAMSYLTKTDFGLAVVGSTKTGGMYTPEKFHEALASGKTWGEAYKDWFNQTGKKSDEWNFGVVILGDPLLTLDLPLVKPAEIREEIVSSTELSSMRQVMGRMTQTSSPKNFRDYLNP